MTSYASPLLVEKYIADVEQETVEWWRLTTILAGCKAEDFWNADENGCFYTARPHKTSTEKKKQRKGGKKAKERSTVAFFANSAGEKELPVVIRTAAKS